MDAVKLGPFLVPLYRLVVVAALLVLGFVSERLGRDRDKRLGGWGSNVGWVGLGVARVGFVVANWSAFAVQPLSVLYVWQGGFSLVWGVVGGLIYTLWFFRGTPRLLRPAALSALVAAGVGLVGLTTVQFIQASQTASATLPALTLYRLEDGSAIRLDSFRGKPLVLNTWATWCPPCRREMPMMAEVARANPQIHFVFADQGEGSGQVRGFLNTLLLQPVGVLLDPQMTVSNALRVVGYPTTFFFDQGGRRVGMQTGELSRAVLEAQLRRIR